MQISTTTLLSTFKKFYKGFLYIYYSFITVNCLCGVVELRGEAAGVRLEFEPLCWSAFFVAYVSFKKNSAGSTGFQVIPVEFGPIGYR